MERLQRVLAARGVSSRRGAEEMILQGRITVDGRLVTELGTKVDPTRAVIQVDGRTVKAQRPRYLLLYKPRGVITTVSDERDRRTVMDLIKVTERVYPVGRLDRDTEGLLLLTNDGDVANRVMHPRYGLDKEYHVLTLTRPTPATLQRVRDGIVVEGRRVVPKEVRILRESREGLILKVVIHEGLFHVVRRMMDEVGIPVERLRRVRVGPLNVAGLRPGQSRDLTPGELETLLEALHLDRDEETEPVRGPAGSTVRRPPPRRPAAGEDAPAPIDADERRDPRRVDQRPAARGAGRHDAQERGRGGPRDRRAPDDDRRPRSRSDDRPTRGREGDDRDRSGRPSKPRGDGRWRQEKRGGDRRDERWGARDDADRERPARRGRDERPPARAPRPGSRPAHAGQKRRADQSRAPRRRDEWNGGDRDRRRDDRRDRPGSARHANPERGRRSHRRDEDERRLPDGDRDRRPGGGREDDGGPRPRRPRRRDVS